MVYDKNYYRTLNYTNYLSRRGKYKQTAKEIGNLLSMLSLVGKEHSILDFGCATGFLSEAFLGLGYKNIFGYEHKKKVRHAFSQSEVDKINEAIQR